MIKKYIVPSAVLTLVFLLVADTARVSYGNLYIENKTDWDMKVTAKVKDEWDVVTATNWDIPAHGAEKIDNIFKLSDIHFQPDIEDDSKTQDWLTKKHILQLKAHEAGKDLIVSIAKDPNANRWNIRQSYVTAAKIEYGGVTGYTVKVLAQ